MSVLIKGIKMPLKAEGCEVIIRIQPDGTVLNATGIHLYAKAIEIPTPHGRLIDADALFRVMENMPWYDNADRDEVAEELVMDAPTIIEAEGKEG